MKDVVEGDAQTPDAAAPRPARVPKEPAPGDDESAETTGDVTPAQPDEVSETSEVVDVADATDVPAETGHAPADRSADIDTSDDER